MKFLKSDRTQPQTFAEQEPEAIGVNCQICGKPMHVLVPAEGDFLHEEVAKLARTSAVHDHCMDRKHHETDAKAVMAAHQDRISSWEKMCPKEFQKAIWDKAPGFNNKKRFQVMSWKYGELGLLLVGPSRRCKTRIAYKLLEREHLAGKTVGGWTHSDFRRTLSALAKGDSEAAKRFIDDLAGLDVLLLDDLGKGRQTPASEEAFFSLVDFRVRQQKPMIYTMNTELETFSAQVSEEYREPLIARIKESTEIIQF